MDVIDTAADVIRERDQLLERVREMEELLAESVPKITYDAIIEVSCGQQQRIAKAKAILEGFRVTTFGKVAAPVINDALEALEGK